MSFVFMLLFLIAEVNLFQILKSNEINQQTEVFCLGKWFNGLPTPFISLKTDQTIQIQQI